MNDRIRILFLADESADQSWLEDSGYEVTTQRGDAEKVVFDLSEKDLVVLDESLGTSAVRSLLADVLLQAPSMPVVMSRMTEPAGSADNIVQHGLQDILIRDLETPETIRRAFLNAIDRARILHAVQEAEAHTRTIIEQMSDAVLIVDEDEIVLFANPACEDVFQASLGDLFGARLPFQNPPVSGANVTIRQNSGNDITVAVAVSPITWESRRATLLTLHDVTLEHHAREHLQKAREASEKAAAMKSTFLANMSHELRMPLASIIGFAQLIKEADNPEDVAEFAELIRESGNRLLATINTVLEATRLDSNTIRPQPQPFDLAKAVRSTVQLLAPLARDKGLALSVTGPENIVITADLHFLERILNNLVGNAIKFTDKGQVSVQWSVRDQSVRIDVADTGPGIDESFVPQLFQEFTQESAGRDRAHEGTGLGLSIARKLATLMEGEIHVASEKGKGSTFSIFLPRTAPAFEAKQDQA